jgi:transketolase
MRDAFVGALTRLARTNDRIVLVVGDLGYGVVESFREEFPDRFFNAGVAEQNMMGMCAGLASEGFHVFAYSIANFSTFRCAEQIRNDIDYHRFPVTVVAVGGGLAYGNLGYSHHAIQDFALIRSFPNMLIAAPGDPLETVACTEYLVANPQPSYLRLGRGKDPIVHKDIPIVHPGAWVPVCASEEFSEPSALVTTGGALRYAVRARESSNAKSAVFSMPLWGARHRSEQANQVKPWHRVQTVEDHLLDGGFGSWMLESLSLTSIPLLQRISISALPSSICGVVGGQDELMAAAGVPAPFPAIT